MKKSVTLLFLLVLIIAVIAAGIFLLSRSNLLAGSQPTQLVISAPAQGDGVALHSTVTVIGESASEIGLRQLELWINGQQWAAVELDSDTGTVRQAWAWTPSGEGRHILSLRATDARGRKVESEPIDVFALSGLDVSFPLEYTANGGETFAGLTAAYGVDPDALAASNPDADPTGPLSPGQDLTLPIPVPNSPPASPQSGEPPVAPAGPLPGSESPPDGGAGEAAAAPIDLSIVPGFEIDQGVLILKYPVQQIYAYVSLAGQPWFRVPAGDFNFMESTGNTFDLKPHITPQMLAGLPSPTTFEAALWGWSGAQLVYLGELSGVLGGDLGPFLNISLMPTRLDIVGRIRDSVTYETQWTIPSPIPGYYQGYKQGFRWTTSLEGVTGGYWQVSSKPFPAVPLWGPPGQLNLGKVPPPKTVFTESMPWDLFGGEKESKIVPAQFSLDFAQYLDIEEDSSGFGGIEDFFGQLEDALQESLQPPVSVRILPVEFYVRVFPVVGSNVGEPSNTVIVHYGPPEEQPITSETGPLYEVKVLGFTPYRAADPAYQACMVLTQDIQTCHKEYSLDPAALASVNAHMQNVLKIAESSGSLGAYKGEFPDVIVENEVCNTTFPKGYQSCGCPGVKCSSGSSCELSLSGIGSCLSEGFEAGFQALRDFANWVSTTYADLKASVVTFIVENTPIGDLCKAAVGVAGGGSEECNKIVTAAIDIGLAACGIPPSIPNFDQLVAEGEDYLIEAAAQELRDQGIPCESTCEDALREGYDEIKDGMSDAGSGSGSGAGASQQFVPHPLALEQPAMLRLQLTRRPETAAVPITEVASCKLFVWNGATNTTYGQTLEGAPFGGIGLTILPMEPGESINLPMVLDRMPWYPPPGFTPPPPEPGQVLQAALLDPSTGKPYGVGAWSLLYNGSTITFLVRSPSISTLAPSGERIPLPCTDRIDYPVEIPMP